MAIIAVYRFEMYDVHVDEMQQSRRWATLEAIERVGGQALVHTKIEVDDSHLGAEVAGMTDRNFNPHSQISGGFQQRVT